MAKRIALEVLLIVVMTIGLAWLGLAVVSLVDAEDPVAALGDRAPRILFGLMGIALLLWSVLLVVGSIMNRHRRPRRRVTTHLVSLAVSIVVNVLVFAVLAFATSGGWGMLLVGITLVAAVILGASGAAAVLLVELRVLRGAQALDSPTDPVIVRR